MFPKAGVYMKDKIKVQATVQQSTLHSYPILEMAGAERGHEPASDLRGADITQRVVRTFSPQPAFLNSLGYQRRKLIFSCRTF